MGILGVFLGGVILPLFERVFLLGGQIILTVLISWWSKLLRAIPIRPVQVLIIHLFSMKYPRHIRPLGPVIIGKAGVLYTRNDP